MFYGYHIDGITPEIVQAVYFPMSSPRKAHWQLVQEWYVATTTAGLQAVKLFSKLNLTFLQILWPYNCHFGNINKRFSGWTNQWFGQKRFTGCKLLCGAFVHKSASAFDTTTCGKSVFKTTDPVTSSHMYTHIWGSLTLCNPAPQSDPSASYQTQCSDKQGWNLPFQKLPFRLQVQVSLDHSDGLVAKNPSGLSRIRIYVSIDISVE